MQKKIISFLLALTMIMGLLAGCGNGEIQDHEVTEDPNAATEPVIEATEAVVDDYSERVDLVFYQLGNAPAAEAEVEAAINEILLEKVNATVDFQFSTWTNWTDKYNTMLTTKGADIIYAANWAGFGNLAKSGAFYELDDLLDTVSPELRSFVGEEMLDACRVNGKIMTIPSTWKQYSCYGFEYREDLRAKYDLPYPDSVENVEAYLLGIKENEPNQPLLVHNGEYALFFKDCLALNAYGLRSTCDEPGEVYDYWFSDEFIEDMKLMKKWADLGFWSRSIAADTSSGGEEFDAGMCVAMVHGMNPNKWANRVQDWATTHPEWETGFIAYRTNFGWTVANDPTNDTTAITASCKNPERAMKVLELLMLDKELNMLLHYGIEGVHYTVSEDGLYQNLDSNFGYEGLSAWGLRNPTYKLSNGVGGQLLEEKFKEYAEITAASGAPMTDPFTGFTENSEAYVAEKAAVSNVIAEYLTPLMNGLVNDVDASVATFREKVKEAGLDVVREYYVQQWMDYLATKGY